MSTGAVDAAEGTLASFVILIATVIQFGGAAYFTGHLYGKTGMSAIVAGFVVVLAGLLTLGGLSLG